MKPATSILKLTAALAAFVCCAAAAAPDEDRLGKRQGYPAGTARTWFFDQSVRVGSFSAQAAIPGIADGGVHELKAAARPLPLPRAKEEPRLRWQTGAETGLTIDDYLARQRIMGLLIIKDGVVQVERYQYERKPQHRFVSQSMAKSILSIGIGIALHEGKIQSLDERAERYAPKLAGTLYGQTTLRNLLRMASGARFIEDYSGNDDSARYAAAMARDGIEGAAAAATGRDYPQGTHFNYASVQSHVLGAVLRGATGMSLSDYLAPRLWQAIGAETSALWRTDKTGLEIAGGHFNATLRDFGRLGVVLANDGVRPDDPAAQPIIPLDYLLDATDWRRAPEAFRPGKATPFYGYGYQFWLFPGKQRRFALLGVYGQMIFVDPQLKLVLVQTAANETAHAGKTSLGREATAFWRAAVNHYGSW